MPAPPDAVDISVERPAVPLLWLDTSIIIALARSERGGRGADQRVVELVDLLDAKRQAGKLLGVESDQSREVEGHPGASSVRQRLRRLSYNVRIRNRLELDRFQAGEAMRAYLAGANQFRLSLRVFFRDDPDAQVRSANQQGWFLIVGTDMDPEIVSRAKQVKERTREDLERMRERNLTAGRSYEEQLVYERSGFLDSQREILARLARESSSPNPDLLTLAAGWPLQRYLRMWLALGGEAEKFEAFFASDHFRGLPCNDIPARLYAQLLTIDREVESGDAMDIEHMAAALPIASWVLTDRSLVRRVRELGLDSDWGCSVHSLRSIGELTEQLEAL